MNRCTPSIFNAARFPTSGLHLRHAVRPPSTLSCRGCRLPEAFDRRSHRRRAELWLIGRSMSTAFPVSIEPPRQDKRRLNDAALAGVLASRQPEGWTAAVFCSTGQTMRWLLLLLMLQSVSQSSSPGPPIHPRRRGPAVRSEWRRSGWRDSTSISLHPYPDGCIPSEATACFHRWPAAAAVLPC